MLGVDLAPGETRAFSPSVIADLAAGYENSGMDVDNIGRVQLLRFGVAKDPCVIHVDNVRLERNLGGYFDRLMTIVQMAEQFSGGSGELARKAMRLRQEITARRNELAKLPFSREAMKTALSQISELRQRVIVELSLLSQIGELVRIAHAKGVFSETGPDAYHQQLRAQFAIAAARTEEASRVALAANGHPFAVGWTNCVEQVNPYGQLFTSSFGWGEVAAARNEREGIQLAVIPAGKDLSGLTLAAGEFRHRKTGALFPPEAIHLWLVAHMNRGHYPEGTAAFKTQWVADICWPLTEPTPIDVPADAHQGFIVEFRVPKDAEPGTYRGSVTFSLASGAPVTKPVVLKVHDFVLPFPFTMLTASDSRNHNRIVMASHEYDDELLIEYGMDPTRIYGGYDWKVTRTKIGVGLDFFKRRIAMGQKRFALSGGELDDYRERLADSEDDKYVDFFSKVREAGLADHFFFYKYDEMRPDEYEGIINWINDRYEEFGVKTLVTVHQPRYIPAETADPAIIWCPTGQLTPERARTLRDAGCGVWWYGAKPPKRTVGWQTFAWGLDGFLLYRTDNWTNYWANSLSADELPFTNWREPDDDQIGAAITYFRAVYDSKTRMPSLRLLSFRDGVEDFEYLQILKRLTDRLEERGPGKKWLAHEARVLLDLRSFTGADWLKAGADEIMKQRARVADMIEHIQQELKDKLPSPGARRTPT